MSLNEYQNKLADVNKDGSVSIIDATQIQKYLAGLIDKF
ncbi:MAG: dockerin type I domain-containing protein [Acutalibacteraceae bacterium]